MLLLSGGRAAGARGLQQLQPGAGHRLLELMAAQLGAGEQGCAGGCCVGGRPFSFQIALVHPHFAPAGAPYSSSAPNTPGQGFIGSYTPITKQLWETRQAMLGAEQPAAAASARPPKPTSVTYGFTQSRTLTELYRNPWGFCRVGRLLEDIDSVSGTVAFDHWWVRWPSAFVTPLPSGPRGRAPGGQTCSAGPSQPPTAADPRPPHPTPDQSVPPPRSPARPCCSHQPGEPPPLLVTASVDAIDYVRPISLEQDVCMSGQVVWTGRSSLDIRVQLTQASTQPRTQPRTQQSTQPSTQPRTQHSAP